MLQYPTCRHTKEDGSYCGSPALRNRPYCHNHLIQRGRRLRRARALRDNVPYRLDIPSLDSPYAIRAALTEVAQALATGLLQPAAAGKLLYAIQQASAVNRRIEQLEAAAAKDAAPTDQNDASRTQEYPGFEKDFDLAPGADLDAEIEAALSKADAEYEFRHADAPPPPPAGMRLGSPAYRVYREEAYQVLKAQLQSLRRDLRDYYQEKAEKSKKAPVSDCQHLPAQAETA